MPDHPRTGHPTTDALAKVIELAIHEAANSDVTDEAAYVARTVLESLYDPPSSNHWDICAECQQIWPRS